MLSAVWHVLCSVHCVLLCLSCTLYCSGDLRLQCSKEKWDSAVAAGDVGSVGKPRLMEVWAGRRSGVGRLWARKVQIPIGTICTLPISCPCRFCELSTPEWGLSTLSISLFGIVRSFFQPRYFHDSFQVHFPIYITIFIKPGSLYVQ